MGKLEVTFVPTWKTVEFYCHSATPSVRYVANELGVQLHDNMTVVLDGKAVPAEQWDEVFYHKQDLYFCSSLFNFGPRPKSSLKKNSPPEGMIRVRLLIFPEVGAQNTSADYVFKTGSTIWEIRKQLNIDPSWESVLNGRVISSLAVALTNNDDELCFIRPAQPHVSPRRILG